MSLRSSSISLLAAVLSSAIGVGCGDGGGEGEPDGDIEQKADNGVALCGKPVVFLNFGPVQIRKGDADDSKQNIVNASALPDEGLDIPVYPNPTDRSSLTRLVNNLLAAQKIPVVHSRPAQGDYFMLVYVNEFLQGIQGGRTSTNCGHTNPNTIGFVNTEFYSIHGGIEYSLHGSMLMLGRSVGADPVEQGLARGNCMVNNEFLSNCSFGAVTMTSGPCASGPQDQLALLSVLACP